MSSSVEELVAQRNAAADEAQGILKALEGKMPDEDQTAKLRTLDESYKALGEEITAAGETQELMARTAAMEQMKTPEGAAPPAGAPAIYGESGVTPEMRAAIENAFSTPGEVFTRSEAYAGWLKSYPNGGPSLNVETFSQPHEVSQYRALLGLRTPTEKVRGRLDIDAAKFRTLVTSSGGQEVDALINSLRRGLIEPGLVRPLTVRDLVTVIPVTTDTIEWVKEVSRQNNAATVAEATAITGTSGLKPEGGVAFHKVTDVVRTIAEWVPVTKKVLQDAGQLRGYIDQYLTYDLALELEDQMVAGSGTGEDFEGILNNGDVQTQTGGSTMLHDLRIAKRKIRVNARTNANGILMNPEDIETMDLIRDASGASADTGSFLGQNPFNYTGNERVWGLPVIESEAVDPGTGVVGDFSRAILYDRESTNISVGTAGDDFIRNIVRVLAELRAGFGVVRPTAFCVVTF